MTRWNHQPFSFKITEEDAAKVQEWDQCADLNHGAIGGHITYLVTPTSLGCIIKAKCEHCGEIIDLTDFNDW